MLRSYCANEDEYLALLSWIASDESEFAPILILIGENTEDLAKLVYCIKNKFNIINYLGSIPQLEVLKKHYYNKERVIITSLNYETLFSNRKNEYKTSNLSKLTESEILDLINILTVCVSSGKNFNTEIEINNFISNLEYNEPLIYSDNIEFYIRTYQGPKWFIDYIINNYDKYEGLLDYEPPVHKYGDRIYISSNIIIDSWEDIFGFKNTFEPIDIKRYIKSISKPSNYRYFLGGKRYRQVVE